MSQHRHRHDPSKTLVGFTVGGVHYAVPIAAVREICNPQALVALPHAPPSVRGVTDYRGEVIPVIELRVRFSLPLAEASRRIKWIVTDVGGRSLALVVDQTLGVFGTAGAALRPAPSLGDGEDVRGIEGVTTHAGEMIFVLRIAPFRDLTAHLALPAARDEQPAFAPPPARLAKDGRR